MPIFSSFGEPCLGVEMAAHQRFGACLGISGDSNPGPWGGYDLRICKTGLSRVQRRVYDLLRQPGRRSTLAPNTPPAPRHPPHRPRGPIGPKLKSFRIRFIQVITQPGRRLGATFHLIRRHLTWGEISPPPTFWVMFGVFEVSNPGPWGAYDPRN
jgi:hypothetical protein